MTRNGNFKTNSNGEEEGELRVDIVSSQVTTLNQDNGVLSHMHPVVRLEPMKDLNEYLAEQMANSDERGQKRFHVLVEEEDSYQDGVLNDGAFSTDGGYEEAVYDEMQSDYVDTPFDTIPVGPNAYAHKTLPTDILERWSKLQREVDGKFSCFMCAYQNIHLCRIKKHLFTHFEDPNKKTPQVKGSGSRLKCGKCQRLFMQSKDLKRHAHIHTLKQSFQCPECSFMYGRQSEVTRHLRIDHGIIPEPRCQECGKLFKTRTSLRQHIKKLHRGERPACTYCGRKFYSKYSLNTHMASHQKVFMETFRHTAEQDESGRWKCNQCSRDFKLKNSLKIHAMSHLDLRPFKCSLCQKSFTSASSLKFHQDIHTGTKRFSCKYCGEQFRQASSLKNHINRHENTFPHVCQHCEKGFNSKSDKDKHEALHVRKVMELQIDPNTGEMAYKEKMEVLDQLPNRAAKSLIPPKCHVCEKLFKSHSILRKHMVIHTGEKPYKCESCGHSFNQIANLGRHKRRQVCKNPLLNCDICGKVFKKEWNLEAHKRTHLPNAKPTAKPTPIPKPKLNTRCTICLRKFSNNMALRGHMSSHKKSIKPVKEENYGILLTQSPTHIDTITADQQLANIDSQVNTKNGVAIASE